MILTGADAIRWARSLGRPVYKYADPTEPARWDLSPEEAEEIAAVDPSLVYVSGPIPPVTLHPAPEACAPVTVEASPAWHHRRGYYARAIGPYAPGGNPVIAGPLRATETAARRDAESPESVLWHVIGHLCG